MLEYEAEVLKVIRVERQLYEQAREDAWAWNIVLVKQADLRYNIFGVRPQAADENALAWKETKS